MFYTSNVHPMLNTQKIHDQLKRFQKSQKILKELNHITNQNSNNDMSDFSTTSKWIP